MSLQIYSRRRGANKYFRTIRVHTSPRTGARPRPAVDCEHFVLHARTARLCLPLPIPPTMHPSSVAWPLALLGIAITTQGSELPGDMTSSRRRAGGTGTWNLARCWSRLFSVCRATISDDFENHALADVHTNRREAGAPVRKSFPRTAPVAERFHTVRVPSRSCAAFWATLA
jgi:hypothetical protein